MNQPEGEKLQKILARAGFGSRRSVETLITDGLVKINGRTATLGERASPLDKIKVRDQAVKETRLQKQPTKVILYNKPEGLLCTRSDEKGRKTIFEELPRVINGRWISIGRLDLNTSGLLILTNNGELANRMMHPSYEVEREYTVRVFGEVTDEALKQVVKGVQLDDGPASFNKVSKMQTSAEGESINKWYKVTIKEGRYREVRRIWEAVGVKVSRLHRVRYGQFAIPRSLRKGKTEELTWKQINQLLKSVDLKEEARPDLRSNNQAGDKKKKRMNSLAKPVARKPSSKRTIHDLSEGQNKRPNNRRRK